MAGITENERIDGMRGLSRLALGGLRSRPCRVLVAASSLVASISFAQSETLKPHGKANLVVFGAKVWSGTAPVDAKPGEFPEPTAIAVEGDTILAVGMDAEIQDFVGPNTKVIEAQGRRVLPGMTDSHTHIISAGFTHPARDGSTLGPLNLREVGSKEAFIQAITASAKTKAKGQWVTGGRWSVESWKDAESPRASWIDAETGDVPVFLDRMDGHQALVNSAALKLAGIDAKGPPNPPGGEIERDPRTGAPTGILKESAMGLVERLIPPPSADEKFKALRRAVLHANSLGITSIHDMSDLGDLEVFRRAEQEGRLTLRITSYVSVSDWSVHMDEVLGWKNRTQGNMFHVAGFKGYMDGSLGSRTAYMREPYLDAGTDALFPRGQLTAFAGSQESFLQQVAAADRAGLQLAVHAIGDEAIHLLLGAYVAAAKKNGARDARHRVEHAQHILPADIPRFARTGVVASMQPYHKSDDGRYAEKTLGKERLRGSYAFRDLVDTGALLVFGSDWPVVTVSPWYGIDAAVNAKTLTGEVWLADHSLTVEEALRSYTVLPPRAVHQDNRLGTIEKGRWADFVLLEEDPLSIPTERLADVRVAKTIIAGEVVFSRAE